MAELVGIIRDGKLIDELKWIEFIESLNTDIIKDQAHDLKAALINAIKRRIPKQKFGIFLSGGVDSSFITLICKELKADFMCYTVGIENSADIESAKAVAKELGIEHKFKVLTLDELEPIIKEVTNILGEPNVVNVGVGAVVFATAELAKKDGITTLFSGIGTEEIFAGYERHAQVSDVHAECWRGLKDMHKQDLVRDYKVGSHLKINVLTPFLDKEVISEAMQIPPTKKINDQVKKIVFREIAHECGLKKEFAFRKKTAAQYGSKFDKALEKLTKKTDSSTKKIT